MRWKAPPISREEAGRGIRTGGRDMLIGMDSGHPAAARAGHAPWGEILKAAAALAAAMGVGRFVYTAILPLMHTQAGLSTSSGADLATANYAGYLAGALAGSVSSRLARSS